MQRLYAVVSGHVQGVSFRFHVADAARELSLTGWVRNLPDGTVEVIAEGERTQLDSFLQFLHDGPPLAEVERLDAEWRDATGEFETFQIVYVNH